MTYLKWFRVALPVWLGAIALTLAALVAAPLAGLQREVVTGDTVTAKATIVAIDKDKRLVTLRGPKGNDMTVVADEKVKRFDELKVGDIVTATYSQSIAIRVRKPGTPAPPADKEAVTRQPDGATVTREQTASVTVKEIDIPSSTLIAEGPGGRSFTFKVRDKSNLHSLKVGDKVDVSYTEALLLKADRPK